MDRVGILYPFNNKMTSVNKTIGKYLMDVEECPNQQKSVEEFDFFDFATEKYEKYLKKLRQHELEYELKAQLSIRTRIEIKLHSHEGPEFNLFESAKEKEDYYLAYFFVLCCYEEFERRKI